MSRRAGSTIAPGGPCVTATVASLAVVVAVCVAAAAEAADAGNAAAADPRFFVEAVAPIIARRCQGCHGADTAEAGLRLDTRAGIAAGGRSGPVIAPGDADASLLVQAVRRVEETLAMPPEDRLAADEVTALAAWIDAGAAHPEGAIEVVVKPGIDLAAARRFWSLTPPARAVPPRPAAHPIDAFLDAEMATRGIEPAAIADKATLIRRASFDLTGLPPAPEEIDAFLADESPDSFARVIDRLLASPHYGEHWGRHWLDVVRYADSNGLDENVAHGNAWRYRDWVVRAFNDDKPYDDFVREQVAGDLLVGSNADPARVAELRTATGFLSLGPKFLAEGDQTKLLMDVIDEQVDTLGRAFLGLSLGCARCHDHKFDPVTQADYYALAGILKSTATMESLKRLARWRENVLATPAEQEAQRRTQARIEAVKAEVATLVTNTRESLAAAAAATGAAAGGPAAVPEEAFPEEVRTRLAALRKEKDTLETLLVPLPAAMGVADGVAEETRIHVRGSHLALGRRVPRGVPVVLEVDGPIAVPRAASGRRELAEWLVDPRNPLADRVIVNRLWRWHFGRGIVPSTDNFGVVGEPPTNQPLLDWLATEFVARGRSLKAMHRLIMLSAAWRRSSDPAASPTADVARRVDPDNTLWWRADVRRLEAESIRDAMLAAAGTLDRKLGGSLLQAANRAFIFDHTSKDETRYDVPRRSLYLPVIRNHIIDAMWLFDCTDGAVGNGNRSTSTIASQALHFMNGDGPMQAADAIGRGVVAAEPADAAARAALLFRRLLGRRPSPAETATTCGRARELEGRFADERPGSGEAETAAWTVVAQAILAGNEFVIVR
jgi:cytochrome c553